MALNVADYYCGSMKTSNNICDDGFNNLLTVCCDCFEQQTSKEVSVTDYV